MRQSLSRRNKLYWAMLSLFLAAILVASCTSGTTQPTKGDVYIYVAVPLSGFQANAGQTVLGGVRLIAAEINARGGLMGYRVVVEGLDDESDSEVATTVAQRVADDVAAGKPILGVIGHLNSGQTLAAMEIYKDLPFVVITPTASEVSLTQRGYRNFFRVNANDAVQAKIDAEFLNKALQAQRVAVLHNDDPYGIGLAAAVVENLKAAGIQVVAQIQVQVEQREYGTEVSQLVQAKPDAIFYAGYEVECPYLRYALVRAGLNAPFLASDGCFLAATIDESDGTAEGIYVSAFGPSPWTAASAEWIAAYQAVEYRNPDTYSLNGYVAGQVLLEGAAKAGSLKGSDVAQAIRQMEVSSLLGPISYDANGDVRTPAIYIFQVREGRFVQVYPEK
ncbi:MAG: branched-chain amino acid ABC transporter substrate-binding protein [Anaerolineae bacterium]